MTLDVISHHYDLHGLTFCFLGIEGKSLVYVYDVNILLRLLLRCGVGVDVLRMDTYTMGSGII